MKYVISDIHGCYREYLALLEKLRLSEYDHLYILGDAVDKGPAPIKVMQDLIHRKNVTYLLGNHDFLFCYFLGKNGQNLTEKNLAECDPEDIRDFQTWLKDGGITTAKQYMHLSYGERTAICTFLENAGFYHVIKDSGKTFLLVHAGIEGFREDKPLKNYHPLELICTRTDYTKRYYSDPDTFVITGHTPTPCIREDEQAEVYRGNGHIAIDCGCVYGGKLAAYCIETGGVVYAEGRSRL